MREGGREGNRRREGDGEMSGDCCMRVAETQSERLRLISRVTVDNC